LETEEKHLREKDRSLRPWRGSFARCENANILEGKMAKCLKGVEVRACWRGPTIQNESLWAESGRAGSGATPKIELDTVNKKTAEDGVLVGPKGGNVEH